MKKNNKLKLLPPGEIAFIVIVISLGFGLAFDIANTNFAWAITYGKWFIISGLASIIVLYLKMKDI